MDEEGSLKVHHAPGDLHGHLLHPNRTRAWEIEATIWAPRRGKCDARDHYDTDAVYAKMVDADWFHITAIGRLVKVVLRADDGDDLDAADLSEMDQLKQVVIKCAPWFYSLFDWCDVPFRMVAQQACASSPALHM